MAADFVAGLQRLVDPATGSAYAQYIDVIANANDIVAGRKSPRYPRCAAPDDPRVIIKLATPAPYLPTLLSHPSTCPVTVRLCGSGGLRPRRAGGGNGAFVLKRMGAGRLHPGAAQPHYWNDAATRLAGVRYL